jgi:hypothetical protein
MPIKRRPFSLRFAADAADAARTGLIATTCRFLRRRVAGQLHSVVWITQC